MMVFYGGYVVLLGPCQPAGMKVQVLGVLGGGRFKRPFLGVRWSKKKANPNPGSGLAEFRKTARKGPRPRCRKTQRELFATFLGGGGF